MNTNGRLRVVLLMATDFVIFYGTFIVVAALYKYLGGKQYDMSLYWRLWPAGVGLVAVNAMIRLYQGNFFYPGAALSAVEELRRTFFSVSILYLILLTWLFSFRAGGLYSRLVVFISYGLLILLIPVGRWLIRSVMKHYGISNIRAILAGAGHSGEMMARELQRERQSGLLPIGFLDDDEYKQHTQVADLPVLGTLADAARVAAELRISYIIVCLPLAQLMDKLRELSRFYQHILVVPTSDMLSVAWLYPYEFNGYLGLEIRNQLLLPGPRIWKWMLECGMAFAAIVLLAPVLAVLAVLVKLTSAGPIFYCANRVGRHGIPIKVYKFRTMYVNADDRLEQILAEDPRKACEWHEKFKLSHDPRVTPLGRFLRRTSLDELPQLWNVLKGDMAMIGPRPIVETEKAYYGEHYEMFTRVKPGITGLWQVSGRSDTTYERRIILDMYYIMNWSVWLDYFIFLKTLKEVLFCRGAK